MYQEAVARAKKMQQEAMDNANAITNGSRQYADDMLADVQRYLNDYIKMLNTNREELNVQALPEYEEKDVEKSVVEQRAMEEKHTVTAAPKAAAQLAVEPEDEAEDEPVRPARKEPKKAAKPAAPVYDDEDDEPKKPKKKGWFKRMLEGDDDEDEFDDDEDWSEDDEPQKEAKPKKKRHKLFEIVEVDEDEDDEDFDE